MSSYPMEWVSVPRPRWVETPTQAYELLGYLSDSDSMPVAVDTETNGLDRSQSVVQCWSLSDGRRRYVLTREMLPLFERWFQETKSPLVFHNANFDTAMLLNSGVDLQVRKRMGRRVDTMVMHHWIDQNLPHDLEWVADHELGLWKVGYTDTFGKEKRRKGEAAKAPIIDPLLFGDTSYRDKVAEYASWDAYLTYLAWMKFDSVLKDKGLWNAYYGYETRFQDAVYIMERNGILVDKERLASYVPLYEGMLEEIQSRFNEEAGFHVNLESPLQLRTFFYEVLGLQPPRLPRKKGGTKGLSTAAAVLDVWAKEGNKFAQMLLRHRNLSQQHETYVTGLLKRVHGVTGRLYTDYTLDVADTGRLSSKNPNLQNIVNDDKILPELKARGVSFRDVFVAPEGYEFWDFDYSQLEMCIGAHFSQEPKLINAIRSGMDLHSLTAAGLLGVPYEAVLAAKKKSEDKDAVLTDAEVKYLKARKVAKVVNFGVLYGEGPQGLAHSAGISEQEAEAYIKRFFDTYPGVLHYTEEMKKQVFHKGYVMTLLGRRRIIEGGRSLDRNTRGSAERAAINTPIQGTASDILRRAMIPLANDRLLEANNVRVCLQVHDELLFEVPKGTDPRVIKHIQDTMSNCVQLRVPLRAEGHCGPTWASAK